MIERHVSSFRRHGFFATFIIILGFSLFQGLLYILAPFAHREFLAGGIDLQLAAYITPAFLCARIWLGAALIFLVFALQFCDFGQKKREAAIALVIIVVSVYLSVVLRALQFPYCIDDAYIDFRHARNLVLHGSLDYNLGDPVMGFTSHLHLWILSLLGWVVGFAALPHWSQNFNILCDLFSLVLLFKLGCRLGLAPIPAAMGSALLALSMYQINSVTQGKEANLLILLIIILIFSIETDRLIGVAWSATLIFLARPEGVLFAGLAGLWCLYSHGWRSLRCWIIPGALAIFWYALLLQHFGTIWPQGMVAKSLVYRSPPKIKVLATICGFILRTFGCRAGDDRNMSFQALELSMVLFPLGLWAITRSKGLRFYLIALGLITGAFMVKNVSLGSFPWYFAWYALLPALVLPFIYGKFLGFARNFGAFKCLSVICCTAFLILIAISNYPLAATSIFGVQMPYPLFTWDIVSSRLLIYEDMANRIKAEAPAARVAPAEDGMFGYTYGGPILTLDGLAFRDCARYYPLPDAMHATNFAISPKLIQDENPDYVVFPEVFGRNSLLLDKNFLQNYELLEKVQTAVFMSKGMYLYKRSPDTAAVRAGAPSK